MHEGKELIMRYTTLSMVAVLFCLALLVTVSFGAQNDAEPSVFFPETGYEFLPVLEGTKVVHDFVIQNKGTAELNVEQVKTG